LDASPDSWVQRKNRGYRPMVLEVVAKVAKTFGVTRVNAETLGEFRYEFFYAKGLATKRSVA
jgi:hypothetical protein